MKFSYSFVKKLLPRVPAKAKLAEALNSYSFETENLAGDLLDISLPSNRYSDAASHLGIAREAGASLGLKLKNPVRAIVNPPSDFGFLDVEVKDTHLCPRYAARYFEIKKISSSPLWLQKIFKTCGLKPINNIVDLMNYVMLEVGQPLHAFDADKIATSDKKDETRKIIVRRAKNGERIETLDGQKFILDTNDLVIADSEKALAIAGVKGGANSGVDKNTKRIIVEAANFDPVGIFKTSRKLKLITDASVRFDHGLSPGLVDGGLDRVTELLLKSGAKLLDSVDVYPKPVSEELIKFDIQTYEKLIGAPVSANGAKSYFRSLGFSIEPGSPATKKSGSPAAQQPSFLVRIPNWRTDIENFEDLAEEISRLSGYGKLRPQPPAIRLKPATEDNVIILKGRIRKLLSHFHLDEVYNYSFISLADAERSGTSATELVELENPVSQEFRYLAPNLEGGLIKNIAFNSRFFDTIRVFEIGNVFRKKGNEIEEKLHLGIALSAKKEPLILELKGIADELLKGLGVTDISFVESGGSLRVESGHQVVARLKIVHLEKGLPVGGHGRTASVAEFDLEKLLSLVEEEREFKPLPKYPAVVRDISLLIESDARIGAILAAIQKASPALIEDVDLIDEYQDEKLGNRQSLTFRIVFQAEDRTLTDEEVNREMEKISVKLKKDFRAEIR